MRTGFAEALLREAFLAIRDLRAQRRRERGLAAGEAARGLGKLLVVAPDQATAKHYLGVLRSWMPAAQSEVVAQLATADTPRAHEALASFRLRLRARLGEMVAAQAVEDEAGRAGFQGGEAGPGLYHRYNAALKRVCGNKSRAEMTLAELDAAIAGWSATASWSTCICSMTILAMPGRRASAVSGNRLWDETSDHRAGCDWFVP